MSRPATPGRLLRKLFPTRSPAVRTLLRTAEKVLAHDVNLLILGESGVGKDQLAEAIHLCSRRRTGPFIRIECATLPVELFESELFGHEKGAFTDATSVKIGRIELANGGTAYIDEVASLSPELQAKLLRVIQEKVFSRVGSNREIRADVRFVASSNAPMNELLSTGSFREDLYYRLNVVSLLIPPLRERPEDVQYLSSLFLRDAKRRFRKDVTGFDPRAAELLLAHRWPGNVRELRNAIERAVLIESGATIRVESLPLFPSSGDALVTTAAAAAWSLEELEAQYIRKILQRTDFNFSRAAFILGINRKTLLEKRRKYGITSE
ncbi:MAG: sigma-54 dependent transcriptional regulator [Thermoanaerobaculia bacterium]